MHRLELTELYTAVCNIWIHYLSISSSCKDFIVSTADFCLFMLKYSTFIYLLMNCQNQEVDCVEPGTETCSMLRAKLVVPLSGLLPHVYVVL